MSNKLNLIKKLDDELGDKSELKEPKTLRLLKEISKNLNNNNSNSKEFLGSIRKDLNNILDEIDFKDYTEDFKELKTVIKEIKERINKNK